MGLTREEERAAWYLAGLFDGEGSVFYRQNTDKGLFLKGLKLNNTDKDIIDAYCNGLEVLGIKYRKSGPFQPKNPKHSRFYRVDISTYEDIDKFYELVPIQSKFKVNRLKFIYRCNRNTNIASRPIKEINELYWNCNLTIAEIANRLEIPEGNIAYYMRVSNIPRRNRAQQAALRKGGEYHRTQQT
jgi:hypothetical protein